MILSEKRPLSLQFPGWLAHLDLRDESARYLGFRSLLAENRAFDTLSSRSLARVKLYSF